MIELNKLSSVVKPHLSALHLNTRIFNQHINELNNLLDNISLVLYFIGCSETFLTSHSNIPGYIMLIDY